MPLPQAPEDAAEHDRDWTSVPSAALAVVSKHATTRTTPGGCRLARVCSGWRSAVRRIGPVVIKRGASIGASMPMCTSLSQWLGSNGAGLVCLQLQGLTGTLDPYSSPGSSTADTIISGLYHAARAAAADGGHLQLQQLSLDGDSLQPAMPLLPLLPNLQQLEMTVYNVSVDPTQEKTALSQVIGLEQLRGHQGLTRLTLNFTVTPDFTGRLDYGSKVAAKLLGTGCPEQLQDLTLRWQPVATMFGLIAQCSIHLKQLAHLKQLRKLTLDKVGLCRAHAEDAEVNEEVVGRLQQVKLLFQDQEGVRQQLDPEGLAALLPKLVELHATHETMVAVAASCSNRPLIARA